MKGKCESGATRTASTKRWELAFITSMAIISISWLALYQAYDAAPLPLGTHTGDGWWGWFDQGQYLKITQQFAAGDFFNPEKYYPPLYPALPAIISNITGSTEAYLALDLTLCLAFFGGLFFNFRAYLNPLISLSGVALMYGSNSITYEQWLIPWTTNLSSTILIAISLLVSGELNNHHQQALGNWRTSTAFFLTAAMVWVRPFEIIPASIMCLGLLALQIKHALSGGQPFNSSRTAKRLIKSAIGPFITLTGTITLYSLYNLRTFGSWEPNYSKTINSMGFSPWDLAFKFISLTTDSSSYGVSNGHLSHYLPFFIPLGVLAIISLGFLAFPQQILVSAAIINFASYLSFNDLVPTGLFTFNNVHYFTWSLAVISVAGVAAIKIVIESSIKKPRFRRIQLPILAACWTITTISIFNLTPQTNAIKLASSKPAIVCPSERSNANRIKGKAAQYKLLSNQSAKSKKPKKTRLLQLNITTTSDPTKIHLAHQNQINLSLNDVELQYRKDWRLVNRKPNKTNKLSILLHQPVKASDLRGVLTIGEESNIELPNIDFNKKTCDSQRGG